jgi:hypothetical protein
MLNIPTLFIVILFAINANAQIKKGTTLLGGQIAANSGKSNVVTQTLPAPSTQNNTQKSSVVGINIGTAFKENKVVGLNFITTINKDETDFSSINTSTNKSNQYEIGLFYRQYKKLAKDFYFFGQADVAAIFGNGTRTTTPSSFTQTSKNTGGRFYVSTGVGYAVLKKLHVEISLPNIVGLQFTNSKVTTNPPNARTEDSKQLSFNSALTTNNAIGNLAVGFRLIL